MKLPLLASLALASPAWLIAAVAVPAGASTALYMVLWDTTLQERVPREALARVSSFERISVFAPLPIGMALAGPLAQWIGVEQTLWIAAAWLGVSTLFLLSVPSVRRMQRLRPARDGDLRGEVAPAATGGAYALPAMPPASASAPCAGPGAAADCPSPAGAEPARPPRISGGRSRAEMTCVGAITVNQLQTFSSCRTLPGHSWVCRTATASWATRRIGWPVWAE